MHKVYEFECDPGESCRRYTSQLKFSCLFLILCCFPAASASSTAKGKDRRGRLCENSFVTGIKWWLFMCDDWNFKFVWPIFLQRLVAAPQPKKRRRRRERRRRKRRKRRGRRSRGGRGGDVSLTQKNADGEFSEDSDYDKTIPIVTGKAGKASMLRGPAVRIQNRSKVKIILFAI